MTDKIIQEFREKFSSDKSTILIDRDGIFRLFREQSVAIESFIKDALAQVWRETIEEVHEFVADERDKAEAHYKDDQDDYSQGYYMAMNTVMKMLENDEPLKHPTTKKEVGEEGV